MKNFLIAYTGREGSSAIINLLGKQTGVVVPLFEDLDKQNFQKFFEPEEIAAVLDYVYGTGKYDPTEIRRLISSKNSSSSVRDKSHPFMVGFKWRPFEETRAATALRQHDVTVGYLYRRDFLELVCSLYITSSPDFARQFNLNTGERHPQFRMRRMTAAERETFLSQLDDFQLCGDQKSFLRQARRVLKSRGRLAQRLTAFQREGVTVQTLFYEDFLDSNEMFVGRLLASLDSPRDKIASETRFTKVMRQPAADKIVNLPELLSTPEFESMSGEYSAVVAQFDPLLAPCEHPAASPTAAMNTARAAPGQQSQQRRNPS